MASAVDGHEQVQLALFGADPCDVDVEVADRVSLEARAFGLVAVDIRQATDAVTLQAAVSRRAGQMRDRGLKRVQAVVERQQGMPPDGDDDRLVLHAQHTGAGLLRPHPRIRAGLA